MTIDEAIKLLNTAKEGFPISDAEKYYKAISLGIEALKRVKDTDHARGYYGEYLLPGETEE